MLPFPAWGLGAQGGRRAADGGWRAADDHRKGDGPLEDTLGFFDIFWSIFWVFLMVAWIWVVISVLADVFRSRDIGGASKALWVLFIIVIPWLGVLAYILLRGDRMQQHQIDAAREVEDAQRDYLRDLVGISPATELEKLAGLKQAGIISEEEFLAQKARVLNG